MRRRSAGSGYAGWAIVALLVAATAACTGGEPPSLLEPASDAARRMARHWWVLFWISAVVTVVVVGFIAVAAWRRATDDDAGEVDRRTVPWGAPFVVIAGLVVSGLILGGTFLFSLRDLAALASPPEDPHLEIEIVGHNWWWEVRYPNGAVTANEIHIPAGVPVELSLRTADVIHSFWVPQLQLKKDLVPGMDNRMWLQADQPGRYRGQCAEFCGLQHANMLFYVVADPPDRFERWMEEQAVPAPQPDTASAERGRELLLGSSCAGCHTIRGTTAQGELGPDLTHLASRETIGAGVLPLTRGNLLDFVADPQDDKRGVTMPPTELSGDDLEAVADYLMQLR